MITELTRAYDVIPRIRTATNSGYDMLACPVEPMRMSSTVAARITLDDLHPRLRSTRPEDLLVLEERLTYVNYHIYQNTRSRRQSIAHLRLPSMYRLVAGLSQSFCLTNQWETAPNALNGTAEGEGATADHGAVEYGSPTLSWYFGFVKRMIIDAYCGIVTLMLAIGYVASSEMMTNR